MRDEYIRKNFKRSEFACKGVGCCGGSAPIDDRLVCLLQAIRDFIEKPVTVLSGFRCIKHNSTVPNAVPDSYHTLGWAADICVKGMSVSDLYNACLQVVDLEGYGHLICYEDRGFVHVDIRDY
jgi:zinc D-Ala-D-Ala carboxypeptidase